MKPESAAKIFAIDNEVWRPLQQTEKASMRWLSLCILQNSCKSAGSLEKLSNGRIV